MVCACNLSRVSKEILVDIARASINRPINTWLIIMASLLGGSWGMSGIGRLEDPAFAIKMALVITPYPGATAAEVEEEITEPLESAIQQLPQLKRLISRSRPGEIGRASCRERV